MTPPADPDLTSHEVKATVISNILGITQETLPDQVHREGTGKGRVWSEAEFQDNNMHHNTYVDWFQYSSTGLAICRE